MIVIDASAMVEALVGNLVDPQLLTAMRGGLAAPHLLDTEVMSALRGLTRSGRLPEARAVAALHDHADLDIVRYETGPLSDRVWSLRHQFTTYDATYLALAEALDVPLHTCDRKLDTGGHRAAVIVHPGSDGRQDETATSEA